MTTSKCFHCENGEIHHTNQRVNAETELGFQIPVDLYECDECHTKYTVCPNCDGHGYIESFDSYFDCDECDGQGLILFNEKAE